ncbi:MAG: hypothetical protein V4696_03105 [Pseudomonadota bacterium]
MHPITVTPSKNANGLFEWTLTYGGRSGTNGNYPPVSVGHRTRNNKFRIALVDHSHGITFSDDPLWIQADSCPSMPGIDTPQIDKIEPGQTILDFRDRNEGSAVNLWYRLNFNVPGLNPGDPGTFLDPEIRNGGGGGVGFAGFAALAIAVGVAAIAYVAYEAFFAN